MNISLCDAVIQRKRDGTTYNAEKALISARFIFTEGMRG
jgi:hypothetical protein